MAKTAASPAQTGANKIFHGKIFVLEGDFGRFPRTHINIARLIALHGGSVDKMVTDKTTHLVTTIEEFRKKTPASKFSQMSILLRYFHSIFLTFLCNSRKGDCYGEGKMQNCSMGLR